MTVQVRLGRRSGGGRTIHLVLYVVVFSVTVVAAGLVLLVLLTKRAFGQVKALGHTVAEASAKIAEASAGLEGVAPRERP